jgi:hypothetical protein
MSVYIYIYIYIYIYVLYKGKLSLCLTKHYTMNAYGGVDVEIQVSLTSILDGCEWKVSRYGRVIPE